MKRGSQQRRDRGGPGQKVISIERQVDVKLHSTEHAWKASRDVKPDEEAASSATEVLYANETVHRLCRKDALKNIFDGTFHKNTLYYDGKFPSYKESIRRC